MTASSSKVLRNMFPNGAITEYEISSNLLFWGDLLDSQRLVDDLKPNVEKRRAKGEPLGKSSSGVSKTGLLNCSLAPPSSSCRRDPDAQFSAVVRALSLLAGPLRETYGVDEAALHINIYYEKKLEGVPDFEFPIELVELLSKHRIELKFTILP